MEKRINCYYVVPMLIKSDERDKME
jgi:hypothetical protein